MNLIDPTLIYLKASFATTAKTYQSLPSEFIFFSSFTMVKPGFCAKISSQISDPQKTTVYGWLALLGKYDLMRNQQIAKSALKRDICGPSLAAWEDLNLYLFSFQ